MMRRFCGTVRTYCQRAQTDVPFYELGRYVRRTGFCAVRAAFHVGLSFDIGDQSGEIR
jgi:hypothetical protein